MFDHPVAQPPEAQLLTTSEVGRALGLSSTTIRRMARRGELPPIRIGTAVRYRLRDVVSLIDASLEDERPAGRPGARMTVGRDDRHEPA